ncbi:MAG: hypothetical protein OWU84_04345 [Firmicutes bacterium]|nr:hypothetical protein [Bacillota bacterium]
MASQRSDIREIHYVFRVQDVFGDVKKPLDRWLLTVSVIHNDAYYLWHNLEVRSPWAASLALHIERSFLLRMALTVLFEAKDVFISPDKPIQSDVARLIDHVGQENPDVLQAMERLQNDYRDGFLSEGRSAELRNMTVHYRYSPIPKTIWKAVKRLKEAEMVHSYGDSRMYLDVMEQAMYEVYLKRAHEEIFRALSDLIEVSHEILRVTIFERTTQDTLRVHYIQGDAQKIEGLPGFSEKE